MSDLDIPAPWLQVVLLFVILIIYAFCSAIEVSVMYIKKISGNNIHNNETNPKINKIIANAYYLKALQFLKVLIIIFASFDISLYIMPYFFQGLYSNLEISNLTAILKFSQFLISFLFTFLLITFCDSIPKKLAMIAKEKSNYLKYRFINSLAWLLIPTIKLINGITDFVMSFSKVDAKALEEKVSEEEIKALVETASEKGVFNDLEKNVINSIFLFNEITAKDIMVSRKDTYKIDIDDPLKSYLDEAIATNYSRIPVYKDEIDNIIGILNMKSVLAAAKRVGFENIDIKSLLQAPYFVPEMKSLDELFSEMQSKRNHMAILVDEYGGFSGIVTIEDLIEEIMGDINDETDDDEEIEIKQLTENSYRVLGKTELRTLNKELDTDLESENCDTISALLIESLGYIPTKTQKPTVNIGNLSFHVDVAEDNRIKKLTLTIFPKQDEEQTNSYSLDMTNENTNSQNFKWIDDVYLNIQ